MQYKSVTMADLARGSGVSYRTIEGYFYGRNDMACSKAYNIIQIEHYLEIDGRILTGSKSIDDFYETESAKISEKEQSDLFVVANPDYYISQRKHLDHIMEYYNRIMSEFNSEVDSEEVD